MGLGVIDGMKLKTMYLIVNIVLHTLLSFKELSGWALDENLKTQ